MTRQPRRSSRGCLPMPCLAFLCLATLAAQHQLLHVGFVQGVSCSGHRAKGQVSLRSSQPGQQEADPEVEARRLTSGIKKAYSAEKLMKILDGAVDGPIFNFFHASATYTQLVTLKRKRVLQPKDWDSPVLLRLHARVKDMVLQDQLRARETANVLWSMAQLSDRFSIPTQLLAALVKALPAKVKGMKPQELSNCMWASAKLEDVEPIVLEIVPALVAQIPKKANDMKAQEVSNCLWASAQLKDVAPGVSKAVPAIVDQIPGNAKDMIPQHLSNCLWAFAQLKDVAPEVLNTVPAIVAQIPNRAKDMNTQGLSNSLWASAQLKDVAPDVLKAVPAIVMQIPGQAKDMRAQQLSNCLLACALLEDEVPKLLEIVPALVGKIPVKLQDMKPQEMSNSLQALALLKDSIPDEGSGPWRDDSIESIARCAAGRFRSLLPRLKGKDLTIAVPVAIWACARLGLYDEDFLASVAKHFWSDGKKLSALPNFSLCALSWSYQVFSAQNDFHEFDKLLMSKVRKRGFDEADVQSCQRGHLRWNQAKLWGKSLAVGGCL